MTERAFTPTCLHCRYDLRGVPDGCCPECGTGFTLARLRSEFEAAESRVPLGAIMLQVVRGGGFILGVVLLLIHAVTRGTVLIPHTPRESMRAWPYDQGTLLTACVVMLPWVVTRIGPRNTPVGLASLPTLLLATMGFWLVAFGGDARAAAIGTIVGLCTLAFGLSVEPRRTLAWMIFTPAVMLGLTGLLVVLQAIPGPPGAVWTSLCDPRPGQVHTQYPLRRDEAMVVGGVLLTISVILVLCGVPLVWRRSA
jgi:hypothetical protein